MPDPDQHFQTGPWQHNKEELKYIRSVLSAYTYYKYRVSHEERSIFWKVIVSVTLSKKNVYVVSHSKQFLR
jgi:hypothetical protein